jgi:rod shape-determining protein MreC
MRNVFLFLRRFSTFFTFLFLQIICLVIVFRFNKFHNAMGMTLANNVNGKIHEQFHRVESFLSLHKTADSLVKRNAELLNANPKNYLAIDTSIKEIADYIPIDTLGNMKKILHFVYRPATVIYNTTNDDKKNYMILSRGVNNGVNTDMAVIGAETNSVIGKIVYADAKYSVVMTLLHAQSLIPAKLKRTGENGIISWDGKNNVTVTLKRIPSTVALQKGDSVVTSNSSDIFPENLLIGTIADFKEDKVSGDYIIKVKARANFNQINYVQVIENIQQKDIRSTLDNAKKTLTNKVK